MFRNRYNGKKVLVTGHTGFKGAWLSLWLKELGAEVIGISRDIPTEPSFFKTCGLDNDMKSHFLDVRNLDALKEVIENESPDIIFHLAAEAIVGTCFHNPIEAFSTNLMGSVNVLECLRTIDKCDKAVMITSDKCYENVEWHYGYRENDKLGGKDPYSASKACAENAFSAYSRSYFKEKNILVSSTRAGNVIGGGDWAEGRIVPDCVRAWSQNKKVEVRNPNATRPWQLVLEPLSGYIALGAELLDSKIEVAHQSYNFGPGSDVISPVIELIEEFKKSWDHNGIDKATIDPLKGKEANLLKLCCDKALTELAWSPTLNFEETIEMTASWYKKFYSADNSMREYSLGQIRNYTSLAKERKRAWATT